MISVVWRLPLAAVALVVAGWVVLAGGPAQAVNWCFEDIGCPAERVIGRDQLKKLSCENLRHVRNAMYDQNGYCFRDRALAELYNNADCTYASVAAVPLNKRERQNVERIVAVERGKGCR